MLCGDGETEKKKRKENGEMGGLTRVDLRRRIRRR